MKTVFLMALACIVYSTCFAQHQKFSINFSPLLWQGSTPTTTVVNNADAISLDRAAGLTSYFVDSTKLDFKCIYNGCQNRAAVMSSYLQKKGIKHYKIWNFNPYKMALFNRQDALDVSDPLNLIAGKINWDFHVAVALLIRNKDTKKPDTVIIDPAFVRRPLKVKEWLDMQNSPTSSYTFLDPTWYNYVTLTPGTSYSCGSDPNPTVLNLPTCFPQLITGDFYKYDSNKEHLAITELATNEQITKAAVEIIYKLKVTDPKRGKLMEFVSNYNSFQAMLQGSTLLEAQHPFYSYVAPYRKAYNQSVAYWTNELQSLR